MMAAVSLALLKKHVRADDFSDDDVLLQHYLEAATASVIKATNRTEEELMMMNYGMLPAPLVQAILVWAGDMYAHREATGPSQFHEVPYSLSAFIKPYVRLTCKPGE